MFSHKQVWFAIDALAQQNDMSVSRLARNAKLDPTTFNKSKRITADGRQRWPSTESLAKIMNATNSSIENFMSLMSGDQRSFSQQYSSLKQVSFSEETPPDFAVPHSVPLLGLAHAGSGGFFDDAGCSKFSNP